MRRLAHDRHNNLHAVTIASHRVTIAPCAKSTFFKIRYFQIRITIQTKVCRLGDAKRRRIDDFYSAGTHTTPNNHFKCLH